MFSELVDSVILRSGRADKKSDIIDYANATLRECQAKGLFFKDLIEDKVSLTDLDPLIWQPPQGFRQLRTVQYPDLSYPPMKQPGRVQHTDYPPTSPAWNTLTAYYYLASNYVVFTHCGTILNTDTQWNNNYIGVAYYVWRPRLKYYTAGHRPAVFSDELAQGEGSAAPGSIIDSVNAPGWQFFDLSTDIDSSTVNVRMNWQLEANRPPSGPPNALTLVSNWMLTDWLELIKEGTLTKLFKSVGDNTRAQTSFIVYKEMQKDFIATELMGSVEK